MEYLQCHVSVFWECAFFCLSPPGGHIDVYFCFLLSFLNSDWCCGVDIWAVQSLMMLWNGLNVMVITQKKKKRNSLTSSAGTVIDRSPHRHHVQGSQNDALLMHIAWFISLLWTIFYPVWAKSRYCYYFICKFSTLTKKMCRLYSTVLQNTCNNRFFSELWCCACGKVKDTIKVIECENYIIQLHNKKNEW